MDCQACGQSHTPTEVNFDDTCIVSIDSADITGFNEIVSKIGEDRFSVVSGHDREHLPFIGFTKFQESLIACTDLIVEHDRGYEYPPWSFDAE